MEFEDVIKKLRKMNAKKVFIQYPEGLKMKIIDISKRFEKYGFDIVICVEPCYGACDIRDMEAKRLGCDIIVHIGHSEFGLESEVPVIYWEYEMNIDSIPLLEKEFHKLEPYKSIGLITSVQFIKTMSRVKVRDAST